MSANLSSKRNAQPTCTPVNDSNNYLGNFGVNTISWDKDSITATLGTTRFGSSSVKATLVNVSSSMQKVYVVGDSSKTCYLYEFTSGQLLQYQASDYTKLLAGTYTSTINLTDPALEDSALVIDTNSLAHLGETMANTFVSPGPKSKDPIDLPGILRKIRIKCYSGESDAACKSRAREEVCRKLPEACDYIYRVYINVWGNAVVVINDNNA
jgi:hypothetical protein